MLDPPRHSIPADPNVKNYSYTVVAGDTPDAAIRQAQRELNDLYDRFTEKHGLINNRGNALALA